jgi:6-phosphogluconolactonase (cycloisomerase 2 family)
MRGIAGLAGAAVAIAVALVSAAPASAAPVSGALRLVGCYEGAAAITSSCTRVNGFTGLGEMASDLAGQNVYVTARTNSATGSALSVFSRNSATGGLTQTACFAPPGNTEGCTPIGFSSSDSPLVGVIDAVVSKDGMNVYAVSSAKGAISEFSRATNGSLTYLGCVRSTASLSLPNSGCSTAKGLVSATDIAMDPQDATVYVAGYSGNIVGVLQRGVSGSLLQPAVAGASPWCASRTGADDNGTAGSCLTQGLVQLPHHIQVTPNGDQILVADEGLPTSNVLAFGRASDGSLQLAAQCANATGISGCAPVPHIGGVDEIDMNANGSRIYAASSSDAAVVVVDRDTSTGAMSVHAVDGCIRQSAAGCTTADATDGPYDIQVSKDGKSVYTTTLANHSVNAYDVTADGGLIPKAGPFSCVYGPGFSRCMTLQFDSPMEGLLAVGSNLYSAANDGTSGDRLIAWTIDKPPACSPLEASTAFNSPITLTLPCSDPDGDALAFSDTTPIHGSLGAVQPGGQVSYAPQLNTTGDDTFQFTATETIVTNPGPVGPFPSAPIAVGPNAATVHVGGPASPPPSSGPTGRRAAALKKCKKKESARARKRCKTKAKKLPV